MVQRFDPGCCCYPGCNIFDDSFTRGNSTNLGSDWTEVDGDWSISSNRLVIDEEGLCLCNTAHPDSEAKQIVSVALYGDNDGDQLGIVVDYDDSDNYHCVLLKVETGDPDPAATIEFYKVTAGTPNKLGATIADIDAEPNTWYNLKVCFTGTSIVCVFDSGDTYARETTEHGGYKVGVIVNAIPTMGTVLFDDFDYDEYWSSTNSDCETCQSCAGCISGRVPSIMKMVVTGFANSSCINCNNFDATYYVPFDESASGSTNCRWQYNPGIDSSCGPGPVGLCFVDIEDDGTLECRIITGANPGLGYTNWVKEYGAQVNCVAISAVDVPWSTDVPSPNWCNGSGTTCTLTAM